MWGALSNIAEKAKAAAADLEGQLDASVGIENQQSGNKNTYSTAASMSSSEDAIIFGDTTTPDTNATAGMDDAWNDDDFNVDDDAFISTEPLAPKPVEPGPVAPVALAPAPPAPPAIVPPDSASASPPPTPIQVPVVATEEVNAANEVGDDSGWGDDGNLQFEEVNLQASKEDDQGEEVVANDVPTSKDVDATDTSVASVPETAPAAADEAQSMSPVAAAAAVAAVAASLPAVSAVATSLPAVSGFFGGSKNETTFSQQPPSKDDAAAPPVVDTTETYKAQQPSPGDEEPSDREATDGWAGEEEELDFSEVDNTEAADTTATPAPEPEPPKVEEEQTNDDDAPTEDDDEAAGAAPTRTDASDDATTPVETMAVAATITPSSPMATPSSPKVAVESDPVVSTESSLQQVDNMDIASPPTATPTPTKVAAPAADVPPPPPSPVVEPDISSAAKDDDDAGVSAITAPAATTESFEPVDVTTDSKLGNEVTGIMQSRLDDLQRQLQQREEQLMNKTEQMSQMQHMFDTERQELQHRVEATKEEAKRRIQMAKERVESMETKLQAATAQVRNQSSMTADDAAKQQEMIDALRQEGEKLAVKQLGMEKAVRAAKGEARELREELEQERDAKETALSKIGQLETDLKSTKEQLAGARKGESMSQQLETTLQQAREEGERKASTILSLEQQVKELKAEAKDLLVELESSRKGAAIETEREQKKLRKEHNSVIDDLETKLRTTEKEAAVREDALRHEVSELRKRWQDAVRRADSLSMDVQSSTAPLLRQLESMERQSRARAAGWAELETKLRAELEETVISNEKLSKERMDYKTKFQRLERTFKERDEELRTTKASLEDATAKIEQLETKVSDLETKGAKQKEEWAEVERLANEGVSRVRSEMSQTVVEAEERHRSQLDALEAELRQERDKKRQMEQQVQDLLDSNAAMIVPQASTVPQVSLGTKEKKLRNSEDQAHILAGALNGLGNDAESDDEDDERDDDDEDHAETPVTNGGGGGSGSFAALAELSSKLKVAKVELNTLRKSLADSERTREKLLVELGDCRNAKEKLPHFETRVEELTIENKEMSLEIQGLQDDISEVRELYRTQLNVLLEEKAATTASNGQENPTDEAVVDSATDTPPLQTEAATEQAM